MRVAIYGTLTAVLITAAITALLKACGAQFDPRSALSAMGAAIVAAILASLPLILVDRHSHVAVMQAGLLSTVIHMMMLLAAAAVVLLGHLPAGNSFVYWLGIMYAATLLAVVTGVVQTVRSSTALAGKV
jgi:hypothetical protein